ncbi:MULTISPECIES: hypothetical protein [Shouchella]|uniref:Uncharacterized protein n=3 Tax=Bacillaceae TaxID=186817 RepID=A0A060M5L6_9BACI|nr:MULTISPECIES: hypothetical protein [Bacillaceae]RQW18506.1 hypothetical protein EH196_16120 [Bacillus sp. C1-1]AIC95848.1 hypothetical protein BleG1_3301 [Shouchella lehensis G1]KQL56637.1 hypothetical protein AN965_13070 [Alkalicoccobacillus plakortidis]MBG9784818.1 hypothetical protein [Shouchella lehensis]TES46227.1 hypothetical protein E2L03_16080 [Shouchella lehensis]
MRDVSIVKEQRNILREELGKCINKVKEMKVNEESFKQMDQHEQQVYIYLDRTMQRLRTQINALEFVLNEDSQLADPYADRAAEKLNINRNSIFGTKPTAVKKEDGDYELDMSRVDNQH